MSAETVVYEPNQRLKTGFISTWVLMFRNVIRSRELIYQLFRRDFLMQYKKSFLGTGWIILSPLVGIISWVFMNQTNLLDPGDVGIPYPAYVLLSTSIWGLFMGYYGAASNTLESGKSFIMQVNYPHESLLFKEALQQTVAFLVTFIITLAALFLFGVTPAWTIIFFPIVALPVFFLGAAMGLVLSVTSVVATDISSIVNKALGFVFFITPVIYAPDTDNATLQTVIKYNPLTYLITALRDIVVEGKINDFNNFMLVSIVAFILFLLSLRLFYVSEDRVVEKMI